MFAKSLIELQTTRLVLLFPNPHLLERPDSPDWSVDLTESRKAVFGTLLKRSASHLARLPKLLGGCGLLANYWIGPRKRAWLHQPTSIPLRKNQRFQLSRLDPPSVFHKKNFQNMAYFCPPQNVVFSHHLSPPIHHNLTIKTPRSALHFSQKPLQKSLSTTPEKNPQSTFKKVLDSEDTIVAISTPPGRGGIGIVRLSGPNARAIAEPLLKLRHPLAPAQARFAQIIDKTGEDQETVLDEAVVTWFQKPHSYTSEDVVEIASHSSPVLLDLLVRQCLSAGARLAEPGEFTQRAFLSGRLDLTQAEAVSDLIDATTLHQARIAAQQLGGGLSRQITPIKQQLTTLIAALEAGIDFAEDDIDTLSAGEITAQIQSIQAPLNTLEQSFSYGRIVREGFTLAIIGRPNVGKSSLFNRLIERDRAIVTATPGTTRDLVTEHVSLDGIPVQLIDTAGLRDSSDEAESIGIAKSRETMAEADVVLLVLDATAPIHHEEEAAIATLATRPFLIVLNKQDLGPSTNPFKPATYAYLKTSALTGAGIPELRRMILSLLTREAPTMETTLLTNLRQQRAVSAALTALGRIQETAAAIPHEIILLDLYEALQALDVLTGTTTNDDILNLIFSKFCIGK